VSEGLFAPEEALFDLTPVAGKVWHWQRRKYPAMNGPEREEGRPRALVSSHVATFCDASRGDPGAGVSAAGFRLLITRN
jgi:hypothetical protein